MSFLSPRGQRQITCLTVLLSGLGMLVLATAGVIAYPLFVPAAKPQAKAAPSSTTYVIREPNNDLIGVSDGDYAFDTNRSGGDLKSQAAERLQKGDKPGALSLWREELAKNTNDAEALIYQEDQLVLASGKPYITLVVGTILTDTSSGDMSTARDTLQGAYVAQKEHNDSLKPGAGKLLRLLIANSGSDPDYATSVAQQIVQIARKDTTIIGVMGWPYSAQTLNAAKVLSAANIPLVSSTASSDDLTGFSPFFFRVAPSNKTQAIAGAEYIERQLGARRVAVFVDPNNTYSRSLSNDFTTRFINDGNKIIDTEEYKVGDTEAFPSLLQKALRTNPDLIYFAGYASDLAKLLELQPDLQVMGGDALYELGGYSSAARRGFTHLHFTAFAYPDEWGIEGQTAPSFFTLYVQDFDPLHQHLNQYGFSRPASDVMLSYDAMQALLKGCTNALSSGRTSLTPQTLQQGLTKINGDQAIQGVTGQISFGSNGDPVNKAIVVLHVVSGFIQVVDDHGIQGCFLLGTCKNTN